MASLSATIADAVKTDLDAQSWPVTLTTVRDYLLPLSRVDMGVANNVNVFPVKHSIGRITRAGTEREHGIAVVLRAAADPGDSSAVDLLVETVEAWIDRYIETTIGGATPAGVELVGIDTLYDPDLLTEARTFLGGIIITYTTRT